MEPRVLFELSAPPIFVVSKERRDHMERYFRIVVKRIPEFGKWGYGPEHMELDEYNRPSMVLPECKEYFEKPMARK
jgi:hypothetical protein